MMGASLSRSSRAGPVRRRRAKAVDAVRPAPGAADPVKGALEELLDRLIEQRLAARAPADANAKLWLTVEQAAKYAQLSERVIYEACRSHRLRHVRIDDRRSVRLRAEWIDAWLEACAQQEVVR
jgi:excisionase family DNA binding protein